jgi:hypothetical protein
MSNVYLRMNPRIILLNSFALPLVSRTNTYLDSNPHTGRPRDQPPRRETSRSCERPLAQVGDHSLRWETTRSGGRPLAQVGDHSLRWESSRLGGRLLAAVEWRCWRETIEVWQCSSLIGVPGCLGWTSDCARPQGWGEDAV